MWCECRPSDVATARNLLAMCTAFSRPIDGGVEGSMVCFWPVVRVLSQALSQASELAQLSPAPEGMEQLIPDEATSLLKDVDHLLARLFAVVLVRARAAADPHSSISAVAELHVHSAPKSLCASAHPEGASKEIAALQGNALRLLASLVLQRTELRQLQGTAQSSVSQAADSLAAQPDTVAVQAAAMDAKVLLGGNAAPALLQLLLQDVLPASTTQPQSRERDTVWITLYEAAKVQAQSGVCEDT